MNWQCFFRHKWIAKHIDIDDDDILSWLENERTCSKCGKRQIYSVFSIGSNWSNAEPNKDEIRDKIIEKILK